MPAPVLKSLAAAAGVSMAKAEELWAKAKERAAEEGKADNYAYITGILKNMLGLSKPDTEEAVAMAEVYGPDIATRILTEEMPSGVRQSLFQRYMEVERQLRRAKTGKVDWNKMLRAMREAVMTLLSWASEPKVESVNDMVGLI